MVSGEIIGVSIARTAMGPASSGKTLDEMGMGTSFADGISETCNVNVGAGNEGINVVEGVGSMTAEVAAGEIKCSVTGSSTTSFVVVRKTDSAGSVAIGLIRST